MNMRRMTLIVCSLAGVVTSVPSAFGQQVLVCKTLHDDLANFDRRAEAVSHTQAAIDTRQASNQVADHFAAAACAAGSILATNCEDRASEAAAHRAETDALQSDHLRSPLGGSDPVRLRIIAAMRANGCTPLEVYATDYLYDSVPEAGGITGQQRIQVPASQIVRARD
jgi:hypothetical protein